jgi:small subunit ribosomal protein S3
MAQKSSPYAIRVGYNQLWKDYFFPSNQKEQSSFLRENKLIRDYLYKVFPDIAQLKIERNQNKIFVYLSIPEVSLVLGENQENLKKVVKKINLLINNDKVAVQLNLIEVKKVYSCAQTIANLVASQLKKRLPFRLVLRNINSKLVMEKEVKGAKIKISGRLDGAEIARSENINYGKMPLSTIDSNIDIGRQEVITTYGKIGIKVLIYKGKLWQRKNLN